MITFAILSWQQYLVLPRTKTANFRTGSLPAVAGQPDPSGGAALTYNRLPAGCYLTALMGIQLSKNDYIGHHARHK
jgi:hypothetical protein